MGLAGADHARSRCQIRSLPNNLWKYTNTLPTAGTNIKLELSNGPEEFSENVGVTLLETFKRR